MVSPVVESVGAADLSPVVGDGSSYWDRWLGRMLFAGSEKERWPFVCSPELLSMGPDRYGLLLFLFLVSVLAPFRLFDALLELLSDEELLRLVRRFIQWENGRRLAWRSVAAC